MDQLLHEIRGWLGYLERGPVVLQILVVFVPIVGGRLCLRRFRPRTPLRILTLSAVLVVIAALTALLALTEQPYGLSLFFLEFCIVWYVLRLLTVLLARRLSARELQRLDAGILRPLFYMTAVLALIQHLDSLQELAIIPITEVFGASLNLGQIFTFLVAVYFVLIGSRPVAIGLAWVLQKAFALETGSHRGVELLTRYCLISVVLLWVVSDLGVNPTGVLAVTGGLSLGLGFGVKEVFSNFVSGLWLLLEGSVRPGDILFIEGDPCEVRSLGLRAALLWRSRDNAELLVPNQIFFSSQTTTYTGTDRTRRSELQVSAAYRHDPSIVLALLEETARNVPEVLETPGPKALLLKYGDSAVIYSLRFFIEDPMRNILVYSNVAEAVWKAFDENAIEIPFPQQVQYTLFGHPQGPQAGPSKR
ncbi:MAG: mechanosensitive ion channel [Candidatus Binatia bacterium]|nr:mechanosensitive ion channel [Candidatus Binatia bacterium]